MQKYSSKETLVAIGGAGHSGSTVLGFLLGSHSEAFYVGEGNKTRFLGDLDKPSHKRRCKFCGESCPVWGDFTVRAEQPLFLQVAARVERPVIVDSTKRLEWIEDRAREATGVGSTPHLIFLQRDGRAVVNSRVRKYPAEDPRHHIVDWRDQVTATQALYGRFPGERIVVRYEELATNPERIARKLCDWLGLSFEPAMLNYASREHHVLGGNNGTQSIVSRARNQSSSNEAARKGKGRDYYVDHPGGFALDLRWRSELALPVLELFESIAGRFNQPFAWDAQ